MKVLSSLFYQLEIPKSWRVHPVFHASLLTPYKENDIYGTNFPWPPPDLIDGEEEYEVEWILKHQGCPKHHQYLIRWRGYSADEDLWQDDPISEMHWNYSQNIKGEPNSSEETQLSKEIDSSTSNPIYHNQMPSPPQPLMSTIPTLLTIDHPLYMDHL